jgi:hypothetical protein
MATREKKELPFTVETMKEFSNIAEAVKYFSQVKQPVRQKRISNLFNEAHELNIGPVSLNMAVFKKDPKQLETFIKRSGVFQSEKSRIIVKKAVEAWLGKIENVKTPIGDVKRPIDEAKAQLSNETPTE